MLTVKWYEKLIIHAAILGVTIFLGVTVWLMVDMGYESAAVSIGMVYFTGLIIALTDMNEQNRTDP